MSYDALIEDLVSSQADIIGREAINVARGIDGLDVADDGSIERVDGEPIAVVEELVSAYVDDLGGAATVTMKGVAGNYADELDLPTAIA